MRHTISPDPADTTVRHLHHSHQLRYQHPIPAGWFLPWVATLRMKTIIIVVMMQLALLVIFYLLLRVYWLGSFTTLESTMLTTDTHRAMNVITKELHELEMFNASYATWDDSYTYAADHNLDYIEKNYYDQFFSDNHLNILMIVDPAGHVVFGRAFDLAAQHTVPLPARLQQLSPSDPLISQLTPTNSITGILQLPTAPLMIVSHGILTSEGAGPMRGAFLMGRYLNTTKVEELATGVQLSLSVHLRDDPRAPADLAAAWAALGAGAPLYIQPIDDQSIYAYAPLIDLEGRSNVLLRVSTSRSIYAQGQMGIRYFIVTFLGAGFLFAGILLVLLERVMLSRLARLNASVSRVGTSGDLSMRVAVGGNDELSSLAGAFNATLSALEQGRDAQTQLYREVRTSEQKYRAILDAVPDAMFRISADGTYLDFQAAKESVGAINSEALLGKTIQDILAPTLAQQTMAYIDQALQTGMVQLFEFQLSSASHTHDFEARIVASGEGEVLAIVRDITERRKIDRMQREFISTVSHELRTPLTSIRGALGLINGGVVGNLPPQAEQMLHIAYKNSERLALLINDILDIEKLETGTLQFIREPLELGPLLEQALEINRPYAAPFSVTFKLEPVAPGVWIDADGDRLMQVLSNLLSNAAKFSPPGETVAITTTFHDQRVRVSVTDSGPGIPESFRPRIFTKFAQANVSDQRHRGGTGLGLSISRAIIEQLDGAIGYESAEGAGTTFYFELPMYQQ
jgi:PAS domain S-box-containing protein